MALDLSVVRLLERLVAVLERGVVVHHHHYEHEAPVAYRYEAVGTAAPTEGGPTTTVGGGPGEPRHFR